MKLVNKSIRIAELPNDYASLTFDYKSGSYKAIYMRNGQLKIIQGSCSVVEATLERNLGANWQLTFIPKKSMAV